MSDFRDDFSLSLASNTTLPRENGNDASKATATTPKPHIRSQSSARPPYSSVPPPPPQPCVPSPTLPKKRGRQSEFSIFIDSDIADSSTRPAVKKSKTQSRTPLAARSDSANSTPAPSPRMSNTPFTFSHADPRWEDTENYDPQTGASPPLAPVGPPPAQSPLLGSTPRPTPRTLRSRRAAVFDALTAPKSMALYNLFGLQNWKASTKEIKMAWRKMALDTHPDRVPAEEREAATLKMQHLNVAMELLSDGGRRRQHHVDGKLPWAV